MECPLSPAACSAPLAVGSSCRRAATRFPCNPVRDDLCVERVPPNTIRFLLICNYLWKSIVDSHGGGGKTRAMKRGWCRLFGFGPMILSRPRWSAAMRVLVSAVCILLSGCALFRREGEKELGSIPQGPATQAVIQTSLPRDPRAIKFVCGPPLPSDFGQQRVAVTLTNTSDKVIEVRVPRAFINVAPRTSALLFDGSLSTLLGGYQLPVASWEGRSSCDLHFQFTPPASLPARIRVLCSYSTPPL